MSSPTSGDQGAASRKQLRVLLPFSRGSLRIPDELADDVGAGQALVVGPFAKVWPVEVGRDGDGAFLGRGWSEYTAACGVGAGWLLVLRHGGRGVLTVKAFDDSCFIRELGAPIPHPVEATMSSKDALRRPQFIGLLPPDSTEKMLIPPEFVQRYMPNENLDNGVAVVLGPLGKVWRIKLERNQSDVLFTDRWGQFLKFNGIKKDNVLLLRYKGNMVFTVKVFEPNGCQRESKHKDIRIRQIPGIEKQLEAPSASIQKSKSKSSWSHIKGQNKPNESMASLTKVSLRRKCIYEIGPPSWITKHINANTLKKHLALPTAFCDAIGLRESCMITLKTSVNSAQYWQVHGVSCKNSSYLLVRGWLKFCQDNSLKEGDACTFNVVEISLWQVVITRCKENINPSCNQEIPSASGGKCKSKNMWPVTERSKKPKGSLNSWNKASKMSCVYNIGPPALVEKQMNRSTIENHLCLPASFCHAIGIRKTCTVTLKTSLSSSKSWQACIHPYKNSSHHAGAEWKRFCQENRVKVGDVCTIDIVETTLWHVVIARQVALT